MGKYISLDQLKDALRFIERSAVRGEEDAVRSVVGAIQNIKFVPADVVPVVRCADCKYQDKGENDCEAWNLCGYRPWLHIPTEDDAFCSKGDRKDD